MNIKLQSSFDNGISINSKFIKLPLKKQEKSSGNNKKLFSRKPLNNSQNSSRLLSSRLKTQEQQENMEENKEQLKNPVISLLSQSKNIKFVSTKSSKSLEKLFISPSVQNLPTWNILSKKQISSGTQSNYKINSKNNNFNLFKNFTDNNKNDSKLDIVYDNETEDLHAKENIGSTQISSSQNICNQDLNEDEFNSSKLEKAKRNHTSSFCYPRDKNHFLKQCPNCLINCQKVKDLQQQNKQLVSDVQQKQSEIKKLTQKIEKLSRTLKDNENFKNNMEYQIKILKEKQTFLSSQKDQIESSYKKLQINFNKISQQIRYKDLQLNISKVYKTKSHEMQMKVQSLKNQLDRAKCSVSKLMSSRSSQNLRKPTLKEEVTNKGNKYQRQNTQKKSKQPKLTRVYSQDSVFSLSSQQCD